MADKEQEFIDQKSPNLLALIIDYLQKASLIYAHSF